MMAIALFGIAFHIFDLYSLNANKGVQQMIIEKNVPIPEGTGITGRPAKYPFGEMAVGDSVFFNNEPKGSQSNPSMVSKQHGIKYGKKFTSRTEGNGVRIWRVE